jgi:VanZ family protein
VGFDKVLHWVEYTMFGYLLARATVVLPPSTRLFRHGAIMAVAVGVLYAVSDEWHQSFVQGRDASLGDLSFDALGVVCGVIFRQTLRDGVRFLSTMEARSEEALRRGT